MEKSLIFHVLPVLLKDKVSKSDTVESHDSTDNPIVIVVGPLNALIYDQIKKLKGQGINVGLLDEDYFRAHSITENETEVGDNDEQIDEAFGR